MILQIIGFTLLILVIAVLATLLIGGLIQLDTNEEINERLQDKR